MSGADFGLKGRKEPPPGPDEARAFEAAATVRPGTIGGGNVSQSERERAARLAAAETGFASRDPRPVVVDSPAAPASDGDEDMVHFRKPLKRRPRGKEPTYQFSVRARVSVVERFNRMAEELRMSNPELIEYLMDSHDRQRSN